MVDVDTVVIGSGAGGLTAAVALAQAGQRVAVFEQHYLPGGWCHSFSLGGYRFSPGVHYIGELGPEGQARRLYEGLGLGDDLTFYELNPEGYDHVLIGAERFDIPKGKEAYIEALSRRFPRQARGVRRFIDTADRMASELRSLGPKGPLDFLTMPWRSRHLLRWGWRSTQSMLEHYVDDPLVRGILATQSGDHGLPPSMAPAALHCAIMAHYFDGGWYPKGGGGALPRAFIRALRRSGGTIAVRTPVDEILIEGGRAIGVRLHNGDQVRCNHVISNADPGVTFGRLVPQEHQSERLRAKMGRTKYSVSSVSLFFAVDMDLRAAGLDSGNVWFYEHSDIDAIYKTGLSEDGLGTPRVPGLFLTATTLKDPSKRQRGHHTLEAFVFLNYQNFRAWFQTQMGQRGGDYESLKADLTNRMFEATERIVPGIREHVVFSNLGTPLSNEHYVAATEGSVYGIAKTRDQLGPGAFPTDTEIEGLKLCGASTRSHGVVGASGTGLVAAARVLGCRVRELLREGQRPITVLDAERAARRTADARPLGGPRRASA